jgi:hypothetical protein
MRTKEVSNSARQDKMKREEGEKEEHRMKRNSIELRREFGRKGKRSIHNPKSPQRGHVHRPSLINQKQKKKRALTIR